MTYGYRLSCIRLQARFYSEEYGKTGEQLERHNVSRVGGVLFGKGKSVSLVSW